MNKRQQFTEEDLQRLRGFRLMDDDFMTKCFENNIECTELVIQIVLGRDDIKVEESRDAAFIKNLQGRSVVLDIFATDCTGKQVSILKSSVRTVEPVQKGRDTTAALIDANITEPGEKMENLAGNVCDFYYRKRCNEWTCFRFTILTVWLRKLACHLMMKHIYMYVNG